MRTIMTLGANIIVRGRVQGVYFRASTQARARARGLSGWVRNCPDGSVEILALGAREAVEELVAWCHEGPPRSRVDEVSVRWGEYQGGESDFTIRY